MPQMLGPLRQAIYVHSRFEPVEWRGQRGSGPEPEPEPEPAWPLVPAPTARIQTSTSARATAATAGATYPWCVSFANWSPSRNAAVQHSHSGYAVWRCAPAGRDGRHAGRSTDRRAVVLAMWWTRDDPVLDL